MKAWMQPRGRPPLYAHIDPARAEWLDGARRLAAGDTLWDVPTRGAVYGVLLNFRGAMDALGSSVSEAPYKGAPKHPVLYLKTPNTWVGSGAHVVIPEGIEAVEVGATLGVVIGHAATRVSRERALAHVAGYTIVNDVTIPHSSFYRPPIKQKCRDGFCPIGPWIIPCEDVRDPDALQINVRVNGELRQQNSTANLVRPIAQLVSDVSEFLTLRAHDVLLVGVPEDAPLARTGDRVTIEIEGIGRLENPFVRELT